MLEQDFPLFVLTYARVCGALVYLFFLPRRLFPLIARFGLLLVLTLFLWPVVAPTSTTSLTEAFVQAEKGTLVFPTVAETFSAFTQGTISGLPFALGVGAALLSGLWLQKYLLPIRSEESTEATCVSELPSQLVNVVFLYFVFELSLDSHLMPALAVSLKSASEFSSQGLGLVSFANNFFTAAFLSALSIAVPWFLAVLFVSLVFGVAQRYTRWVGSRSIIVSSCSLLICFLLALGLGHFQNQIMDLAKFSTQ